MKLSRRIVSMFLVATLLATPCYATTDTLDEQIGETIELLQVINPEPTISSIGGEWSIIAMAQSGQPVDQNYIDSYYAAVLETVKASNGVLHSRKYTEYSRVILALTSIGIDPRDVGGYDLVAPILDYDKTVWQGINGAIWALMALNSGELATDASLNRIRAQYASYILSKELPQGGWSLVENDVAPDPDITGMALQALASYRDDVMVEQSVQKALSIMSQTQDENGGFASFGNSTGDSVAQMMIALSALKIPLDGGIFVKNGISLWDALMENRLSSGGFALTTGDFNLMATEQALCAMVARQRYEDGLSALYAMDDVTVTAIKRFPDVTSGEMGDAIATLARLGIVDGFEDGNFYPNRTMTRAEFSAIMVRALDMTPEFSNQFSDVTATDWFGGYVSAIASRGIVTGVGEGRFAPYSTITKEQAAVMVARAAKEMGVDTFVDNVVVDEVLNAFEDGSLVASWARYGVAFCDQSGILNVENTAIQPTTAITRGEVAMMIYNLRNLI